MNSTELTPSFRWFPPPQRIQNLCLRKTFQLYTAYTPQYPLFSYLVYLIIYKPCFTECNLLYISILGLFASGPEYLYSEANLVIWGP